MRRITIPLAIILLAGCERPAPVPPPPRPALVVTAGALASSSPAVLVGEVRSRYESALGFRIAGKIIERKVEVGNLVSKGQVLARLDAADAGLAVQAAQAGVRAEEAGLDLAQSELERQRQLYARKFVSAAALDVQEAKFKSSRARLQQARAQADEAGNQSRYTVLVADRAGVVTEIRAEPGQVVDKGEAIVRISVPESMEVAVAVPESRMAGIVTGMPAEVRLWAKRETIYQGRVREIAPVADSATRTFQVRVAIPDADGFVRLGMTAGVRFYLPGESGLLLPSAAVTRQDGRTVVWVVDPKTHRVQPQAVQIGPFREDGVEILHGLNGGEQVVVAGVHALVAGLTVRPVLAGNKP